MSLKQKILIFSSLAIVFFNLIPTIQPVFASYSWYQVGAAGWSFPTPNGAAIAQDGVIYFSVDNESDGEFSFYKSIDDGETWTSLQNKLPHISRVDAVDVDSTDSSVVYISVVHTDTNIGGVYKSSNGGSTWTRSIAGNAFVDITVDKRNPAIVYALERSVGGSAGLYKSVDYGATWQKTGSGLNVYPTNYRSVVIDPNNSDTLYIVAVMNDNKRYGLHKSIDGGENWSQINEGIDLDFAAMWNMVIDPINSDNLYLNMSSSTQKDGVFYPGVYKSTDAGNTWARVTEEYKNYAVYDVQVHEVYPNFVVASASSNNSEDSPRTGIMYSSDYGENWTFLNQGFPEGVQISVGTIRIDRDKNFVVVGTSNGIWKRDISDLLNPTTSPTPPVTPTPEPCVLKNFSEVILQGDSAWDDLKYGGIWINLNGEYKHIPYKRYELDPDSGVTDSIKNWGCALTSYAMMLNYYAEREGLDFRTNPKLLNEWLQKNDGYSVGYYRPNEQNPEYVTDSGVKPGKIIQYAKDKGGFLISISDAVTNQDDLDLALCELEAPAIARVSNKSISQHYVAISGKLQNTDPETYQLHDPVKGLVTLGEYGNTYHSFRTMESATVAQSSFYLSIASPVHAVVTDPDGKRLGYDSNEGVEYTEIDGGSYTMEALSSIHGEQTSERKVVYIADKKEGDYRIDLFGTDSGGYALDILTYDAGEVGVSEYVTGHTEAGLHETLLVDHSEDGESTLTKHIDIAVDPFTPHDIIMYPWSRLRAVPVIIYSAPSFDATELDTDTIFFGPNRAQSLHSLGVKRDFNDDGFADLHLYFRLAEAGITKGTTEACVETIGVNSVAMRGCDDLTIMTIGEFIKYLRNR